ncbi:MAG: hypothetical protein ABJH05_00865 [Fulvivirga sp.]
MKNYIKGLFLIAILLIPICIFLFLKFFGENKFDIPVYYSEGVTSPFPYCESYSETYTVEGLAKEKLPGVFLFFEEGEAFDLLQMNNVKNRLSETVGAIGYSVYTRDSTIKELNALDSATFIQKLQCQFVSDTLNQYILVDSKSRIRGYYDTERDEIDRLIVELKILLENERISREEI